MRGRKESWKTAEAQVLTIAAEGLLSCFPSPACCCCRPHVFGWGCEKTRMTPSQGTYSLSLHQAVCEFCVCAWAPHQCVLRAAEQVENQLSRDASAALCVACFCCANWRSLHVSPDTESPGHLPFHGRCFSPLVLLFVPADCWICAGV